jgi:hypothetical protein
MARRIKFEIKGGLRDDWLYLKFKPQTSFSGLKLHSRYYGPFQVIAKVGRVAVSVQILVSSY